MIDQKLIQEIKNILLELSPDSGEMPPGRGVWYQSALELYKKSQANPSLARLLSSGETLFFRKKLVTELENIIANHETRAPLSLPRRGAGGEVVNTKPKTQNSPSGAGGKNPELDKIIQRRNQAVRRQDYLRGQLQYLRDVPPEKAYPVCREILQKHDEINACWKVIHHYNETGILDLAPLSLLRRGAGGEVVEIDYIFSTATTYMDIARIHSSYKSNVSKSKNGKLPKDKLPFYQAVLDKSIEILTHRLLITD